MIYLYFLKIICPLIAQKSHKKDLGEHEFPSQMGVYRVAKTLYKKLQYEGTMYYKTDEQDRLVDDGDSNNAD